MQRSFYDLKDEEDGRREDSDFLYNCFMSKNTDVLNTALQEIKDLTCAEFTQISKRFKGVFERAIQDECRIAKHGALLFGIYLTPKYVEKLIRENRVDPQKFQYFIQIHLAPMCQQHLNGEKRMDSMQAFVEEARMRYIIM